MESLVLEIERVEPTADGFKVQLLGSMPGREKRGLVSFLFRKDRKAVTKELGKRIRHFDPVKPGTLYDTLNINSFNTMFDLDRLIPVSRLNIYCPRQIYLQERLGLDLIEKPGEPLILGSLMHSLLCMLALKALEHRLRLPERDLAIFLKEETEKFLIEQEEELKLNEDPEIVEVSLGAVKEIRRRVDIYVHEIIQQVRGIEGEISNSNFFFPEYNLIGPQLGLQGRVDFLAVSKNQATLIEYKFTTTRRDRRFDPSWLAQLAVYMIMTKESGLAEEVKGCLKIFHQAGSILKPSWQLDRTHDLLSIEEAYNFLYHVDGEEGIIRRRNLVLNYSSAETPIEKTMNKYKCKKCHFYEVGLCDVVDTQTSSPVFGTLNRQRDGMEKELTTDYEQLLRLIDPDEELNLYNEGKANIHLIIRDVEEVKKGQFEITLERTDFPIKTSIHIYNGAMVRVSGDDPHHGWVNGNITSIREDGKRIKVTTSEAPSPALTLSNHLRIDIAPTYNLAKRGKLAMTLLELSNVLKREKWTQNLKVLERVFLDPKSSTSVQPPIPVPSTRNPLNASQLIAIQKILECQDLLIIHGPFGTGKTTIIAEAAAILAKSGKRVLITSHNNAAVEHAIKEISRIDEELTENIVRVASSEEKAKETRHLVDYVETLLKRVPPELVKRLKKAKIVGVTTLSALSDTFRRTFLEEEEPPFDYMFLDEATQCIIPYSLIPAIFCKRWVLIGDHKQLSPVIESLEAREILQSWFEWSICQTGEEKLSEMNHYVFLDTQYRCPHNIGSILSDIYYKEPGKTIGRLKNDSGRLQEHHVRYDPANKLGEVMAQTESMFEQKVLSEEVVTELSPRFFQTIINPENTLIFIDTNHVCLEEGEISKQNRLEAILSMVIGQLFRRLGVEQVLILTPYRRQVRYMNQIAFREALKLRIGTVDAYQGRTQQIVVFSMVRCNPQGEVGFLKDPRRLNVALSRCSKKAIIIGDRKTIFQRHPSQQENKEKEHIQKIVQRIQSAPPQEGMAYLQLKKRV